MRQILQFAKRESSAFFKKTHLDEFVFLFSLAVLPFVVGSPAIFGVAYEVPKSWATLGLIAFLLLFLVADAVKDKAEKSLKTEFFFVLFALFVVLVLSSILNNSLLGSIAGNPYRRDGLVRLVALILFTIWTATRFRMQFAQAAFLSVAGSSVVLSIWAVCSFFMRFSLSHRYFPESTLSFGQSDMLGGYLTITLPFLLFFIGKENKYLKFLKIWQRWGVVALVLLGLLTTQSWGALLAAGVCLLLWKFRGLIRFYLPIIIVLFGMYLGIQYIVYPPQIIAESRVRILYTLTLSFLKKPLLGWGWANVSHAFKATTWPYYRKIDIYLDQAHSTVLELFVSGGVVGGVLYLLLVGMSANSLSKKAKDPVYFTLLLFLLTFFFHSQTNVISINEELLFWWVVGIAGSTSSLHS